MVREVLEPMHRWSKLESLAAATPLARGRVHRDVRGQRLFDRPTRVKRHVALLRAHPEAVLVHHDAVSVRDGEVVKTSRLMPGATRGLTGSDVLYGAMGPWLTMMYRNVGTVPDCERECLNFDLFLDVRLGRRGGGIVEPSVVGATPECSTRDVAKNGRR